MYIKRCFIILIIFSYLCFPSEAQKFKPTFKSLTVEDKLTQNTITDIIQDQNGFIWISTEDGLNRFDGFEIKHFKNFPNRSDEIRTGRIHKLKIGTDSTLWLRTYHTKFCYAAFNNIYGCKTVEEYFKNISLTGFTLNEIYSDHNGNYYLTFLSDTANKFVFYNQDTSITLVSDVHKFIFDFTEDSKNNLWFTNCNDKVFLATHYNNSIKIDSIYPIPLVKEILEGNDGRVFFISDKSIYLKRTNKDAIEKLPIPETTSSLQHVFIDSENNLWGSFNKKSFFRYSEESFDTLQFHITSSSKNYYINTIVEDNEGNIWLGTTGNGIHVYDKKLQKLAHIKNDINNPNGLNHDYISKLFKDKDNNIWIGTLERGINIYCPELNKFNRISLNHGDQTKEQILIRDIKKVGNDIWFASRGQGLFSYSLQSYETYNFLKESNFHFESMHFDGDSVLWLGTRNNGIFRFDLKTKELNSFYKIFNTASQNEGQNYIRNIYSDKQNNLWFCTWGGIIRLDPTRKIINRITFDESDFPGTKGFNFVFAIIQYTENKYLIGTEAGIGLIDFNGNVINQFKNNFNEDKSLPNNTVFTLFIDSKKRIWAGTYGGGFVNLDINTGNIRTYNSENGLSNDCVHGILEDQTGNLWMSTNNGLNCFNPENEEFTCFYKADGLPSSAFNFGSFFNDGQQLWYWTEQGVVSFNPEKVLHRDLVTYRLTVTDFEVLSTGKDINYFVENNNCINLAPNENTFRIGLVSPSFSYTDKINYEYKISPLQSEWIDHGKEGNFIFNNLPYGKYTIHFRVKSLFGEINPDLLIPLIIKPPFTKTFLFKALILLFFISILFLFILFRIIQIRKLEKVRLQIANDLHDEIGSSISNISFQGFELSHGELESTEIKKRGLLIQELSKKIAGSIREILWFINPVNDHISKIFSKMELLPKQMLIKTDIQFFIEPNIPDPKSLNLKRNLFLIYKEVIVNICKHAKADEVIINIRLIESCLMLYIFDNGIGFNPELQYKGLGLKSIQKRVEESKGEIEIHSGSGKGTSVKIKLTWKKKFRLY